MPQCGNRQPAAPNRNKKVTKQSQYTLCYQQRVPENKPKESQFWLWNCQILLLTSLLLTACSRDAARTDQVFEGATMGTTYTVKVVTEGPLDASSTPKQEQVQQVIEERLAEVNHKMSTYQPPLFLVGPISQEM
jgi:hypothetical protein